MVERDASVTDPCAEVVSPVDQRFLEALNRAKSDTLESFAAIWYRHNSEAGYYWEMLARHHYDHSR